jgi:hypothetical protein
MRWDQPGLGLKVVEVSVVGRIGPVIEQSLQPCVSSGTHLVTILQARVAEHVSILDVVDRLTASNVDIVEIALVGPGSP